MANVQPGRFEPALLRVIGSWLGSDPVTVLACGMVGARQGWIEAPYRPVPAKPTELPPIEVPCADPRLRVQIMPGLSQSAPPDVMRGEETQIAGYLATNPGWDGVLCLPGTHTKWVHVSAGEVVSFQTFMTGETFALLSDRSVLRHSVATSELDASEFLDAAEDAMSHPERLTARLFGLRARDLLEDVAPATARARLSGLLIGAELAAARPYWLGQNVAVIGSDTLSRLYDSALSRMGVPAERTDATALTLAGLTAAFQTQELSG